MRGLDMTDKEIIKAFEYYDWYDDKDTTVTCVKSVLLKNAYFLMCRQQTEIERLTDRNKRLGKCVDLLLNNKNGVELIRVEAIKELADRLGEHIEYRYNENCDFVPYVKVSDIEKVAKEMIGVEK